MSATLLEAPRRAAAPPPPPPAPGPGPPKPRPRPGRHALAIGIVVSVVAHVIFFSIRFSGPAPGFSSPSPPRVINLPAAPGMHVLDVVAVAADVPTPQVTIVDPVEPEPSAPVTAPPARPSIDAPAAPARAPVTERTAPLTVTERITPRSGGDPRLFERASDPLRPELDPLNNVRARVYGSIAAYNDSIAAAAAAAERALDWSVRDKNGGRWGVSPSGIHLGTITLPLPALGASAGERAAMREWSDIQQQAGRRQVEETFDDRVRAIRARRDAARDSARRGGGGN